MKNESFAVYISIIRKYFVSYCTEKISNFGVTYTQLFVLIYIGKNNECSPKEIVEYLKIDEGQLNRNLMKKIIFKLSEIDGGKQNEQIKRFYEHIDR